MRTVTRCSSAGSAALAGTQEYWISKAEVVRESSLRLMGMLRGPCSWTADLDLEEDVGRAVRWSEMALPPVIPEWIEYWQEIVVPGSS